jgi:hypothetical protein
MALAVVGGFSSCSDDNDSPAGEKIETTKYQVNLDMPLGISVDSLSDMHTTLTNVQTKNVYTLSHFEENGTNYSDTLTLPTGTYNVEVNGNIYYDVDTTQVRASVKASSQNVSVVKSTSAASTTLALTTYNAQQGLVISEIFFTGTLTPEGKQYTDDQYIRIANNSDSTIYADGLAFVESDFLTTDKEDYTPNIMSQAMTVDAVYVIPGSGKDHPIKPGEQITLALNAKNHKELNANSLDLSSADFEFYVTPEGVADADDDNPNVPNLESWVSLPAFVLHNRGFKAYAIVKPQCKKEEFAKNNFYTYTYKYVYGEYSFDMDGENYFIPNTWIIDAVNLSVADSYQWNVTDASIDAGWAHCGSVDRDQTRYGKAVVRKMSNGKWVDTNNSTDDFESDAVPTLLK